MTRLVFGLLICIFVTASFVDTHPNGYRDYNINEEQVQEQSRSQNLLDLYRTYFENNKENRRNSDNEYENWTGRWMPDRPGEPIPPPKVYPKNEQEHHESMADWHEMGHPSAKCDDAKTNLTIDWDHSASAYTCYGHNIMPNKRRPNIYCEYIPKAYKADHKCMNQTIDYDDDVPLYGPHRPLWPVYGEYMYLPKQRWLHSLEHGAIVMLYHPCANHLEVKRLKYLINQCLWRHIITPYSDLDEDYPLVLLSWGCRLSMSYVNSVVVKHFIQERALRGPERIADDGQFQDGLLSASNLVTDPVDSVLCPKMY